MLLNGPTQYRVLFLFYSILFHFDLMELASQLAITSTTTAATEAAAETTLVWLMVMFTVCISTIHCERPHSHTLSLSLSWGNQSYYTNPPIQPITISVHILQDLRN